MFLGLVCLLLSTGSTRLILTWRCVQLFRIQAIKDGPGPDGPEFLPDLSRPIRNPAVEGEDVVAAGGEGEDDGWTREIVCAGWRRACTGRLPAVSRTILLTCP